MPDQTTWKKSAACINTPTDVFFPPENCDPRTRQKLDAEAKQICATCPVITECSHWASTRREEFGTWAGITEQERRSMPNANQASLW